MTHAYNPIFLLSEWVEELEDLFHLFGIYEFLPQPGDNRFLVQKVGCTDSLSEFAILVGIFWQKEIGKKAGVKC